jgi:putative N6-adenine-specific DNA methylase
MAQKDCPGQNETAVGPGRYLALCPRGVEPLCAAELGALPGVAGVAVLPGRPGAVAFGGGLPALYRANLHLRTASRVLLVLSDEPVTTAEALYEQARRLPWEEHLPPRGTLAVSAQGQLPGLTNTMFTALKVKDAIVDRLRDLTGARPDVRREDPDLLVNVQLYQARGGRCMLSLDSSGAPLHRRGYRRETGPAPMKETLAAAILRLAGYPEGLVPPMPLIDPCCGSGTLLIEGGLIALRRAPGLLRPIGGFGCERWRGQDRLLWRRVRAEAEAQALPAGAPFLFGRDLDRRVLRAAEQGARAAGLQSCCLLTAGDLRGARPPPGPPGMVVCNPPHGERMGQEAELLPLYQALGDTLKRHFTGYTAWVFTTNLRLGRHIGLRPAARHVLYSGDLEGRLLKFELY